MGTASPEAPRHRAGAIGALDTAPLGSAHQLRLVDLDIGRVATTMVEGLTRLTTYAVATVEVVRGVRVQRAAAAGDDPHVWACRVRCARG